MQPDVIFGMLDMLGAQAGRVLVVGCEPASVAEGIGLSEPVAAAVDEAVRVVLDLATRTGPGGQEPGAGQERAGGQSAAARQDPQSTVSDTRR
jgi:hypothetical protein